MVDRDAHQDLRSYSSGLGGLAGLVREALNLVRVYSVDMSQQAMAAISQVRRMEHLVEQHLGLTLESLAMLDVGPGQRLVQMRYFTARGNHVVGADRDLIVQRFDPAGYIRMARSNGLRRALKTFGRRALRVDARFAEEFYRQLGTSPRNGKLTVFQMDATDLRFPANSFDFAYSSSVLQYLDNPGEALEHMARVVKPGGGIYVDFMPFTGPTGCLDIRILGGRGALQPWAHLRRGAEPVQENAPLNRLGLDEWRRIFDDVMPGNAFILDQPNRAELEQELAWLRKDGELQGYSTEELVTSWISVLWRKPPAESLDGAPA